MSGAETPADVVLQHVDEEVLGRMVAAALGDAAAGEVTPPVTAGEQWTPERIDWLRTFHRSRPRELTGPDAEMTWAVVADSDVVGAIRLKRIGGSQSAEIGLWLTRAARGRGVGRRAVAAVLAQARERGLTAVRADTTAANRSALALLEALGFECTAVDDQAVVAWRRLLPPSG